MIIGSKCVIFPVLFVVSNGSFVLPAISMMQLVVGARQAGQVYANLQRLISRLSRPDTWHTGLAASLTPEKFGGGLENETCVGNCREKNWKKPAACATI
jgi:hypothetical protein